MLHGTLVAMLGITEQNGFEKYLSSVQKKFNTGGPTRDEARKDFQTAHLNLRI